MVGKWPYSNRFVGCYFQNFSEHMETTKNSYILGISLLPRKKSSALFFSAVIRQSNGIKSSPRSRGARATLPLYSLRDAFDIRQGRFYM